MRLSSAHTSANRPVSTIRPATGVCPPMLRMRTLLANSTGTMYLLEHAVKSRAEKFLFFSSGEVYGVPLDQTQLIGEQDYGYIDPMNVRSCYAESKRIGETMCVAWAQQYKLHASVVRPFHTYGPGMALDDGRRSSASFDLYGACVYLT